MNIIRIKIRMVDNEIKHNCINYMHTTDVYIHIFTYYIIDNKHVSSSLSPKIKRSYLHINNVSFVQIMFIDC